MPTRSSFARFAMLLWLLAALAAIAGVITHCVREGEWHWPLIGVSAFCIAMALGSLSYADEQ